MRRWKGNLLTATVSPRRHLCLSVCLAQSHFLRVDISVCLFLSVRPCAPSILPRTHISCNVRGPVAVFLFYLYPSVWRRHRRRRRRDHGGAGRWWCAREVGQLKLRKLPRTTCPPTIGRPGEWNGGINESKKKKKRKTRSAKTTDDETTRDRTGKKLVSRDDSRITAPSRVTNAHEIGNARSNWQINPFSDLNLITTHGSRIDFHPREICTVCSCFDF